MSSVSQASKQIMPLQKALTLFLKSNPISLPSQRGGGEEEEEEETSDYEFSLTDELDNVEFVMLLKTMPTCSACITLQNHIPTISSIVPPNVRIEHIEFGSTQDKRKLTFMTERDGVVVPSAFLLSEDKWNNYLDGSVTTKDLTSHVVAKTSGLAILADMEKFKRWLSDNMHRIHLFNSRDRLSEAECMIANDIQFPLIRFGKPKGEAEGEEEDDEPEGFKLDPAGISSRRLLGKAYLVSPKCNNGCRDSLRVRS